MDRQLHPMYGQSTGQATKYISNASSWYSPAGIWTQGSPAADAWYGAAPPPPPPM